MVVMELQYSGRASPSSMEEEDVLEREREAPRRGLRGPPFPTIYRESKGGTSPKRPMRLEIKKGRVPKGEGTS